MSIFSVLNETARFFIASIPVWRWDHSSMPFELRCSSYSSFYGFIFIFCRTTLSKCSFCLFYELPCMHILQHVNQPFFSLSITVIFLFRLFIFDLAYRFNCKIFTFSLDCNSFSSFILDILTILGIYTIAPSLSSSLQATAGLVSFGDLGMLLISPCDYGEEIYCALSLNNGSADGILFYRKIMFSSSSDSKVSSD